MNPSDMPEGVLQALCAMEARIEAMRTGLHDQVTAAEARAVEAQETSQTLLNEMADLEKRTDVQQLTSLAKVVLDLTKLLEVLTAQWVTLRQDTALMDARLTFIEVYLALSDVAPAPLRRGVLAAFATTSQYGTKARTAKTLAEKRQAANDFGKAMQTAFQPLLEWVENLGKSPSP